MKMHEEDPESCEDPRTKRISLTGISPESLFVDFYDAWISTYKEGSIRDVTLNKYKMTAGWLKRLIPDLKMKDLDRISYQTMINAYAKTHEKQTTMDFHHQVKGAVLDAVEEGLIDRDPTRKVVLKGRAPSAKKKKKYLSKFELQMLINDLDLTYQEGKVNYDYLIFLVAKTGLRFSEALGLTPDDFEISKQRLSVNKTWSYKGDGGFVGTKNRSSVRAVEMDWHTVAIFSEYIKHFKHDQPIFIPESGEVYNSTVNTILERHCKNVQIPVITVHGLRHTQASLLLADGVSIASVARRLGHSSINTTQKTYLHIIKELESKDLNAVMSSLSSLS